LLRDFFTLCTSIKSLKRSKLCTLQFSTMSDKEFEERFNEAWNELCDGDDNACIAENELKNALDHCGYKLPNHQVRELSKTLRSQGLLQNNQLSKCEFKEVCKAQFGKRTSRSFTADHKVKDEDFIKTAGTQGYAYHMISKEEQRSFASWINENLGSKDVLKHLLPLKDDGEDLYAKCGDGMLLCYLINLAKPETIDERAINKGAKMSIFKRHENLNLAINSAKAIGINVINIDSHIIEEGKRHIILGVIWQIIAIFLFDHMKVQFFPGLISLLRDGETLEDLMKLTPEQLLMRWINFQLERAGVDRQIKNFGKDISDSEIYSHLIHQIAPKDRGVNKKALQIKDLLQRADGTLDQADKLDCRAFVSPQDIVSGVEKLNLAFVANLFNNFPALDEPEEGPVIEETREEKMFRNWMNSLGVKPFVNYLYTDLTDGLIFFQIYDIIQEGIVDWSRVKKQGQFSKMAAKRSMEILANCNYAVELGKKVGFRLVNIEGNDIMTGNKTLTLGLVWQLMRQYTLSLLAKLSPDGTPIVESEILNWANQRLTDAGKDVQVKGFHDPVNKTALPVIHLIDAMKSGVIDYQIVKSGSKLGFEDCMSNAKYAITMARRINAPIYALPEDLAEVKQKMVMTIYASLMLVDMS